MVVDVAYSAASATAPTIATLLTGLYPPQHGVRSNGYVLAEPQTALAEILAGSGYRTGGVISSFVLDPKFGFDQGFSSYDYDFSGDDSKFDLESWAGVEVEGAFDRSADETTDRALESIRPTS